MKCYNCNQYEENEDNENKGWCCREHCWVQWNDTPEENDCGYYD